MKRIKTIFHYFLQFFLFRLIPDSLYLRLLYQKNTGKKLQLKRPETFNDKLNWLKLNNHNPIYTIMVDKYAVKQYVAEKVGEEYVVPVYGVYDSFSAIDFNTLPEQFVLKCTHDSGSVIICENKKVFDYNYAKRKLSAAMKRNFYWCNREWPYKNVKPRIIAEKFISDLGRDKNIDVNIDYKFWCFNGKPKYIYLTVKNNNIFENFYDMDFNPVNINHGFPRHVPEFTKPEGFELMKSLAEKISDDIPFVRVDFSYADGRIYFGECTFFDWGGMRPFKDSWNEKLGKLIILPKV